jgi:hypothetical protein
MFAFLTERRILNILCDYKASKLRQKRIMAHHLYCFETHQEDGVHGEPNLDQNLMIKANSSSKLTNVFN